MISKERLQELIDNKQPIYTQYEAIYPHRWKKGYYINDIALSRKTFETCNWYYDLYDLFATKEERDWFYKFGNITRTETLSLPHYKIAKTYIDTDKFILEDDSNFRFLLLSNPDNIIIVDKQQGNQIFNKPLTKENYIEACKLAKKLFLGEVEE